MLIDRLTNWLASIGIYNFETLVLLTFLVPAFFGNDLWYLRLFTGVLFSLVVIFRNLIYRDEFWFLAVALYGFYVISDWHEVGGNEWLLLYFFVAIFLSNFAYNQREVLRNSARLLIGFVFLLAIVWKVVPGEFARGDVVIFDMIATERLSSFAIALTSLSKEIVRENNLLVRSLPSLEAIQLQSAPGIRTLANLVVIATFVIEGAIAVSFLLLRGKLASWARDLSLSVFLVFAYLVLPVASFGTLFSVLGYVQTDKDSFRGLYLLTFIGIQLSKIQFYLVL